MINYQINATTACVHSSFGLTQKVKALRYQIFVRESLKILMCIHNAQDLPGTPKLKLNVLPGAAFILCIFITVAADNICVFILKGGLVLFLWQG